MFSLRHYARSLSTLVASSSARYSLISYAPRPRPSLFLQFSSRWTTSRTYSSEPGPHVQSTVVFVNNMPYSATEEDISAAFSRFNPTSYILGRDRDTGNLTGFCHIKFDDPQDAQKMLEAADKRELEMGGRTLWADYAKNKPKHFEDLGAPSSTLFVGNITPTTDERDLRDVFEKFGVVKRINVSSTQRRLGQGFAHVEFDSVESAKKAQAAHDIKTIVIDGRSVKLDFATTMQSWKSAEPHHKVYFHNWSGDELDLRQALKELESRIVSIYFLRNKRTDALSGSGFIDFVSVEEATKAIQNLDGSEHKGGNVLRLSYARPIRRVAPNRAAPKAYRTDW